MWRTMNSLLLDEYPLLIMPNLATKIGLNESIVLQQIHYWNEMNKKVNNNYKDGYYWTYNSYEKWNEQFPFWSISTIKRTIKKLEEYKLIVSANYNKLKIDRTKWYRIDYEILESVDTGEFVPLVQNDPIKVSDCTNQSVNMNKPLPETSTETLTETKIIGNFDKQNPAYSFYDIFSWLVSDQDMSEEVSHYIEYFIIEKVTQNYTRNTWVKIVDNLSVWLCDMCFDDIENIVDKYLKTNFKQHSLYHSTLENVLTHRIQEVGLISYAE